MKNLSIFIIVLLFLICGILNACVQNTKKIGDGHLNKIEIFTRRDSLSAPIFFFYDPSFDFKSVSEGAYVEHTFHYKNIGHSPLIITKIQTSCGCTTPNFSPRPIAISDTGSFHIVFNSKGKMGPQTKIITIFANTIPRMHRVVLLGVVNSK
jgi:hypothetical protein